MEKKYINVLKLFLNGSYVTATAVSECLDVGVKTARLRIKELDQIGKDNGFRIDSRPHYGYYIKIEDEGKLRHYIDEVAFRNKIPSSVDERTYYLLAFFINHRQYIKQEELCDFLFVSRTTLQYSMKSIETILSAYGISFDRKPNFGLRLQGREVDLRRCIGDYFIRQNFFENLDGNRQSEELQVLGNKVMELVGLCHIHMSETAFESFIHHIYIAIKRIRKGCMIEELGNPELFLMVKEKEFINWLVKDLEDFYHITISEPEKVYLSLYFAGKRTVQIDEGDNFVITEDIRIIVKEILEMIYEEYNVDLRSDFHVQMMMGSHLIPLDIRIRYDIGNKNAMLEEIKEKYPFPYTMALSIKGFLKEVYHKHITEDEISYFAIIFEIALKQMWQVPKSNILIVCNSGRGSSMLLMFKYREEFGEYLDRIYVSDLIHLDKFDFGTVDYVFTTVPIHLKVPVPIVEVNMFLDVDDVQKVRNTLKSSKKDYLRAYYKNERFFTGVTGGSYGEVLRNLCRQIEMREPLPAGFYRYVMNRETMGSTDFGNLVAMPHPDRLLEKETRVFVAVLENPILWKQNEVQVVLLTSIGKEDSHNLMQFYEDTMRAIRDPEGIRKLVREQSFQALWELLQK